jgi:hypothetical protein
MADASRDFLRRHYLLAYDELKARLTKRLGSAELARDALQDTWLRLETSPPAAPVDRPYPYLLRVALNLALRSAQRTRENLTLDDARAAIILVDESPSPAQICEARAELEMLGGAVNLDAYAVWSTADQSANPDEHCDGTIDPAGWYDSNGNLVSGTFTNLQGQTVLDYTAGSMTAAQLATYLTNDYFTPNQGAYDSAHAVFYGGYDPNNGESFNPSSPHAGSLPDFIQNPGFNLGNTFAGVANFQARPEIDLVNPGPVNGGNISVVTNWNLGAGVTNPDGSITLAYRYQGTIAPVISLRAAGNFNVLASITDGFFQAGAVTLPSGQVPTVPQDETYAYADGLFIAYANPAADAQIEYASGNSGNTFLSLDPNAILAAPLTGQSPTYYSNWYDYYLAMTDIGDGWAGYAINGQGFYDPITLPVLLALPSPSDPNYTADYTAAYASYLTAYQSWVSAAYPAAPDPTSSSSYSAYVSAYNNWLYTSNFGVETPTPPTPPTDPSQYAEYLNNNFTYGNVGYVWAYASYVFTTPDADGNYQYIYAPIPPGPLPGAPTVPTYTTSPAAGNAPSNMPSVTNPLATAGSGNLAFSGHTAYTDPGTQQLMLQPTTVRTGTGDIDIAASGDISFTDTAAPAVIYTAGEPKPGMAAGSGIIYVSATGNRTDSLLLSDAVNPAGGGNISITAGGDITGIEQVYDTTGTVSGSTLNVLGTGDFIGQFWVQWLLANPNSPNVPWYVNFSSFDQGVMSLGGNVTIDAQGNISDLAASLPTTGYLDTNNALHVTGGGVLSVTAGGNIYSGDFYVGQGTGTITAGGAVASDFNYVSVNDPLHTYPVATVARGAIRNGCGFLAPFH